MADFASQCFIVGNHQWFEKFYFGSQYPGDSVVTGRGKINGRTAFVFSQVNQFYCPRSMGMFGMFKSIIVLGQWVLTWVFVIARNLYLEPRLENYGLFKSIKVNEAPTALTKIIICGNISEPHNWWTRWRYRKSQNITCSTPLLKDIQGNPIYSMERIFIYLYALQL